MIIVGGCLSCFAAIALVIWLISLGDSAQQVNSFLPKFSDASSVYAKEAFSLGDEQVKMFVAGLVAFKSLLKHIIPLLKYEDDEREGKESKKKFEEIIYNINEFLMLESAVEIKEKGDLEGVKFLLKIVNETANIIDISDKNKPLQKQLIETILEENIEYKDTLTKFIPKYRANLVEIIVFSLIPSSEDGQVGEGGG